MTFIELLGWLAAALVLLSFSLKTMVSLRVAAITSNVVFFAYGALAGITPIMVLHGLLFPLNLWRLHQMRNLLQVLRNVSTGRFSLEMLLPHMEVRQYKPGEIMFREGDKAEHLYLILKGQVLIDRVGVTLHRGELLGEMGLFTEQHQRTASAQCLTEVEAGRIGVEKFWQVFSQDPTFGTYVVRTMVQRFIKRQTSLEQVVWEHTRPGQLAQSEDKSLPG
jgi:CRP/FNR family cyclic AMP-dependent transcriptional regulator